MKKTRTVFGLIATILCALSLNQFFGADWGCAYDICQPLIDAFNKPVH